MKTTVFEKGKQKMNAVKAVSAVALGSAVGLAGAALPVFAAEGGGAEDAIVSGMTSAASSMTGLVTKAVPIVRCTDHDRSYCCQVWHGTVQEAVRKGKFLIYNENRGRTGRTRSSSSFSLGKGGYCEKNKNTCACSSSLLLSGVYWNYRKLSDSTSG